MKVPPPVVRVGSNASAELAPSCPHFCCTAHGISATLKPSSSENVTPFFNIRVPPVRLVTYFRTLAGILGISSQNPCPRRPVSGMVSPGIESEHPFQGTTLCAAGRARLEASSYTVLTESGRPGRGASAPGIGRGLGSPVPIEWRRAWQAL